MAYATGPCWRTCLRQRVSVAIYTGVGGSGACGSGVLSGSALGACGSRRSRESAPRAFRALEVALDIVERARCAGDAGGSNFVIILSNSASVALKCTF